MLSLYRDHWSVSHSRPRSIGSREWCTPRRAGANAEKHSSNARLAMNTAWRAPVRPANIFQPLEMGRGRSSKTWATAEQRHLFLLLINKKFILKLFIYWEKKENSSWSIFIIITNCLFFWPSWCPNRLLQGMKQLEAKSILLAWPLDYLASVQKHRANPMIALWKKKKKNEYTYFNVKKFHNSAQQQQQQQQILLSNLYMYTQNTEERKNKE